MTKESSQTGGPGGPIAISDLLQMIDLQLSILTGIQENLMDGIRQVTLSIRELRGLRRHLAAGTSTINTTKEPLNKPLESTSKEDSSMSSSLPPLDMSGAGNQDLRGILGYDSSGNPYWIYSADQQPILHQTPTFAETYQQFLRHLRASPKTP